MEKVADGVFRLGSRWVNFYLVVDDAGMTLIDTGLPGYVDQLGPALQQLGRAPSDVDAIVLTHTHADHIGGAARFEADTDAAVFVHRGEAAMATGDAKPGTPSGVLGSLWRPSMLSFGGHFIANGGAKHVTVTAASAYEDGDMLEVPGGPRVTHCPGHSPAHSALLLESTGVLFCGDALATLAVNTGDTGPMLHPFNEDRGRAIDSLASLENVSANVILPGHGDPFRGVPADAVARARARL